MPVVGTAGAFTRTPSWLKHDPTLADTAPRAIAQQHPAAGALTAAPRPVPNHQAHVQTPPPRVVRRDADDTYLVVAADKGTATFSDIANAISQEYGFWLGDAFASGGSAG